MCSDAHFGGIDALGHFAAGLGVSRCDREQRGGKNGKTNRSDHDAHLTQEKGKIAAIAPSIN